MIHRNKAKKWGLDNTITDDIERLQEILRVDLKGKNRTSDVIERRQVAMWKLLKMGYSTTEIGRTLGFTHATVLHNARKIEDLLSINDPRIKRLIQLV